MENCEYDMLVYVYVNKSGKQELVCMYACMNVCIYIGVYDCMYVGRNACMYECKLL
ncbi:hypothetical protein HanIR_Chr03g0101731 [Helianthus annuus]|nr:hypothetical protein HanIR_Chr03g0101731 [Helianthus annuus]